MAEPSRSLVRRPVDAIVLAAGLAVLAIGMLIVREGKVPSWERAVFRRINDLPDALVPVLWPFQQLGVLAVGPLLATVAWLTRRRRLAVSALAVTVAKLATERVVKAIVRRDRPGTSIGPDIEVRGDVSIRGESFVSGHALLAAALAWLIVPLVPERWQPVVWAAVATVMVARVYVGAHNPLDVVCGAALGLAVAAAVNLVARVPVPERRS